MLSYSTTLIGWDRSRAFLSNYFRDMGVYDQAIAAGQRALALATASGEVVLQVLANFFLGEPTMSRATIVRRWTYYRQAVASLDEAQRGERFGQVMLPAVQSRAYLAACHAELGTFAEGWAASGKKGCGLPRRLSSPASLYACLFGDRFAVPPPRRPVPGHSPGLNGP